MLTFLVVLFLVTLFAGVRLGIAIGRWLERGDRAERKPPGKPPEPPPEAKAAARVAATFRRVQIDSLMTRAAVHEAGHALVAARCTLNDRVASVAITKDGCGHVIHIMNSSGAHFAWCELVILLAGVAAENMSLGNMKSGGASKDLANALTYATTIAWRQGDPLPWPKADRRSFPFEQVYGDPIHPNVLHTLHYAYDIARAILEKHVEGHARLTAAILAIETLDEKTVKVYLPPLSPAARLVRAASPSGRFV